MMLTSGALYRRKDHKWVWVMGGNIFKYPMVGGYLMIHRHDKSLTTPQIIEIISITETDPNGIAIVFQADDIWKFIMPAHTNDINVVRKEAI